jgi:hypothetical protein
MLLSMVECRGLAVSSVTGPRNGKEFVSSSHTIIRHHGDPSYMHRFLHPYLHVAAVREEPSCYYQMPPLPNVTILPLRHVRPAPKHTTLCSPAVTTYTVDRWPITIHEKDGSPRPEKYESTPILHLPSALGAPVSLFFQSFALTITVVGRRTVLPGVLICGGKGPDVTITSTKHTHTNHGNLKPAFIIIAIIIITMSRPPYPASAALHTSSLLSLPRNDVCAYPPEPVRSPFLLLGTTPDLCTCIFARVFMFQDSKPPSQCRRHPEMPLFLLLRDMRHASQQVERADETC